MGALDDLLASSPSTSTPYRSRRRRPSPLEDPDDEGNKLLEELAGIPPPTAPRRRDTSSASFHTAAVEKGILADTWRAVTKPIKTVVGATQGAIPKLLAGGTDAYARAREAESQNRFQKPYSETTTAEAIEAAPGVGDVLAETIPSEIRESAAGRILGPVGRLAGNVLGDPTTYLGGVGAGTKIGRAGKVLSALERELAGATKLGNAARRVELAPDVATAAGRLVGAYAGQASRAGEFTSDVAKAASKDPWKVFAGEGRGRGERLLDFLSGTQRSGEVARGIGQLLKGEPIGAARAAIALPTSAYTGLAYAPELLEGIGAGAQETASQFQQGNTVNALASGAGTLLQTGLAALVGKGLMSERKAMQVMRQHQNDAAVRMGEVGEAEAEGPIGPRQPYESPTVRERAGIPVSPELGTPLPFPERTPGVPGSAPSEGFPLPASEKVKLGKVPAIRRFPTEDPIELGEIPRLGETTRWVKAPDGSIQQVIIPVAPEAPRFESRPVPGEGVGPLPEPQPIPLVEPEALPPFPQPPAPLPPGFPLGARPKIPLDRQQPRTQQDLVAAMQEVLGRNRLGRQVEGAVEGAVGPAGEPRLTGDPSPEAFRNRPFPQEEGYAAGAGAQDYLAGRHVEKLLDAVPRALDPSQTPRLVSRAPQDAPLAAPEAPPAPPEALATPEVVPEAAPVLEAPASPRLSDADFNTVRDAVLQYRSTLIPDGQGGQRFMNTDDILKEVPEHLRTEEAFNLIRSIRPDPPKPAATPPDQVESALRRSLGQEEPAPAPAEAPVPAPAQRGLSPLAQRLRDGLKSHTGRQYREDAASLPDVLDELRLKKNDPKVHEALRELDDRGLLVFSPPTLAEQKRAFNLKINRGAGEERVNFVRLNEPKPKAPAPEGPPPIRPDSTIDEIVAQATDPAWIQRGQQATEELQAKRSGRRASDPEPAPAPEAPVSPSDEIWLRLNDAREHLVRKHLAREHLVSRRSWRSSFQDRGSAAMIKLGERATTGKLDPKYADLFTGERTPEKLDKIRGLLYTEMGFRQQDSFRAEARRPTVPIDPTGGAQKEGDPKAVTVKARESRGTSVAERGTAEPTPETIGMATAGEIPEALATDIQKRMKMSAKDIRARVAAIDSGDVEGSLPDLMAEMVLMTQGRERPFVGSEDPRVVLAKKVAKELGVDIGKDRPALSLIVDRIMSATGKTQAYEAAKARQAIDKVKAVLKPGENIQFKTPLGVDEASLQARSAQYDAAIDEGAPIAGSTLRSVDLEGDGPAVTQAVADASSGIVGPLEAIQKQLQDEFGWTGELAGVTGAGPISGVRVGERIVLNPVEAYAVANGDPFMAARNTVDTLIHEHLHEQLGHGPEFQNAYADAILKLSTKYYDMARSLEGGFKPEAFDPLVPSWEARRAQYLGSRPGPEAVRAAADALPPPASGTVRLFRGENTRSRTIPGRTTTPGTWFSDDALDGHLYADQFPSYPGDVKYVDVPKSVADQAQQSPGEFVLSSSDAAKAKTFYRVPGGEDAGTSRSPRAEPGQGAGEGVPPRAVQGNLPEGAPLPGRDPGAGPGVPEGGSGSRPALPGSPEGAPASPRVIRPIAPRGTDPASRSGSGGAERGSEPPWSGGSPSRGGSRVQASLTPAVAEAEANRTFREKIKPTLDKFIQTYNNVLGDDPTAREQMDQARKAIEELSDEDIAKLARAGPSPKPGNIAFSVENLPLPEWAKAEAAIILAFRNQLLDRSKAATFKMMDAESRRGFETDSPEAWMKAKASGKAPRKVADVVAYKQLIGLFHNEVESRYSDLREAAALPAGEKQAERIRDATDRLAQAQVAKEAALHGLANTGTFFARGLGAMRHISDPLTPAQTFQGRVIGSLKRAGVKADVAEGLWTRLSEEMAKGANADWNMIGDAFSKALQPKFSDKVIEFWKAGLLGWPTQIANTASNLTFLGLRNVEEGLTSLIKGGPSAARHEMAGRFMGLRRAMADLTAGSDGVYSLAPALYDALAARKPDVRRALERGTRFDEFSLGNLKGAIGGRTGEFIRTPFKILSEMDNAFKHISRMQTYGQEAVRLAMTKRRDGERVSDAATRIFNDMLQVAQNKTGNPDKLREYMPIFTRADQNMNRDTFQAPVGPIADFGQKLSARRDMAGLISNVVVPFWKTPSNILKETIYRTPLGLYRYLRDVKSGKIPADERTAEAVKMGLGTLMMWSTVQMALDGSVTGAGPTDPKQAELLKESGWQPYSFKFPGGHYYSYQRLEPMSSILGIAADVAEGIKRGEFSNGQDAMKRLFSSITTNLTNKTFLAGFEGAVQAVNDPFRYGPTYLKQLEASLVPNIIGTVPVGGAARAIDPNYRQTEVGLSPILAKIPGASKLLSPQRTPLGEERLRPGTWLERLVSPLVRSQEKEGPVADVARELDRIGFALSAIPAYGVFEKQRVYYTRAEQEAMAQAERRGVEALARVIASPQYQALPDKESLSTQGLKTKKDVARDVIRAYRTPVVQLANRKALARGRQGIFRPEPVTGVS